MLPEDYKKELEEKLFREAEEKLKEKEGKIAQFHRSKLEELRQEYMRAAEEFARELTS